MNRKKRRIIAVLLILALLVGLPYGLIRRERRRQRLNRELIAAVKANDASRALALLQDGADGDVRDMGQQSLSFRDLIAQIKARLLHRPAQTSGQPGYRPSALLLLYEATAQQNASSAPNAKLVLALLDSGSPVEDVDSAGKNLLSYAVEYHQHEIVRRLIKAGAQVNRADCNGNIALWWADREDTQMLLEHGANVNATNDEGETALFFADAGTIDLLMQHGAKPEVVDIMGYTPLLLHCVGPKSPQGALAPKSPQGALALIRHGANVNARCADGETALMLASYQPAIGLALIQHGAKINVKDRSGRTPLLMALDSQNQTAATVLLQKGADIRARDTFGTTTLMLAVADPSKDWFRRFLNKGIDINARGAGGNTALSIAEQYQRTYDNRNARLFYVEKARLLRRLGAKEIHPGGDWVDEGLGD